MRLPLLLPFVLPLAALGEFNFSASILPSISPLTEATVRLINEFFADRSNHIYIRRRASDPKNIYAQRDIIRDLLVRIEPGIKVQLETYQAKPLNQSRMFNVFLVDDYAAFGKISDGMQSRTYDYTGFFVVLVCDVSESNIFTVQRIMDDLWGHYIVNVALLITKGQDATPGKAFYYTYFPYGNGACETVQTTLWKGFSGGVFTYPERPFFPEKLANLNGCPLKIATFEIPPFVFLTVDERGMVTRLDGIDGTVARVLSQRLNFSIDVTVVEPPDWGITGPKGSSTGASRYIRDRVVNFSIGYWSTTYSRNLYMGNTFPYYSSIMTTVAPPGNPYSSFEQLILPFKYTIWSCISAILVIAAAVIAIVRYRRRAVQDFVFGRSVTTPLLNTFNIFFGGVLPREPTRNFARSLLAMWLLYSIVIRTSYMTALFQFLQLQPNKTTPKILPEFLAANYRIHMARDFSYVFDAFPDVWPYLQQTTLQQLHDTGIDELQLPSTRYILLAPVESISYINRNITKSGKLLRAIGDQVFLSKLTIYTQRSAPILPPFNALLGQLNAAGLIDQWASTWHQEKFLKQTGGSSEPRQLKVEQVLGCFELLAMGLVISSAVFLVECFIGWRRRVREERKRRMVCRECRKRLPFVL